MILPVMETILFLSAHLGVEAEALLDVGVLMVRLFVLRDDDALGSPMAKRLLMGMVA